MKHRARVLFLVVAAALLALLAGCVPKAAPETAPTVDATAEGTAEPTVRPQPTPADTESAPPTVSPEVELPDPPRPGQAAYDFGLENLDGNVVTLADYRGRRVLLTFWASWCPACREGLATMTSVYDELHDAGLEIVAVNVGDDREQAAAFVESQGLPFPVLLDPTGYVATAYYLRGIPSSLFLDEEGVIVTMHMGTLSEAGLLQRIEQQGG